MKRKSIPVNFIVLTDQHLYIADSLKEIEKQSGLLLEESEFKRIDGNYIVNMHDRDIDYVIDKRRMANIPWKNLVKKDMTMQYLLYAVLAIQFISLLKG